MRTGASEDDESCESGELVAEHGGEYVSVKFVMCR